MNALRTSWWMALGVVAYTYAGYPLLIALLARLRPRPWRREPVALPVTIVMAVHNGATLLPWKLEHLLGLEPALVREVIVVSDGSTDDTAALLRRSIDPRLKPIVLDQHVGKATALNRALEHATGELVLFVDIRPRLEPGALAALAANFADATVGCAAGELIVQPSNAGDAAAASVGGLYWRYEQAIRNAEAAVDSPVGVYGGFYMARRSLLRPLPDGLILDDMFQPLAIIRQGFRSIVDRSALVIDTWPARTGAEFSRKVRTLAGNFQLMGLAPWILSPSNRVWFQLVSHKLLRLIIPYLLVFLLIGSAVLAWQTGSAGWSTLALLQAIFWTAAAVSLVVPQNRLLRRLAPAGALLVLNAAAVAGLWRALFTRGPLWKTWVATAPVVAHAGTTYLQEPEHKRA